MDQQNRSPAGSLSQLPFTRLPVLIGPCPLVTVECCEHPDGLSGPRHLSRTVWRPVCLDSLWPARGIPLLESANRC